MTRQAKAKLAVLLSGNGTNLQAILDACESAALPAQVVVVASNRKEAYGLVRAENAGIATYYHPLKWFLDTGRAREEYDSALADVLAAYEPDWIVLAGWMLVLSPSFLDRYSNRVVNLHPALPGQFPGTDAIRRAFEAFQRGEITETGVMVHLVPDAGIDSGPVLATARVPIYPNDTLEDLAARIHEMEHHLLVDTLRDLITHS